MSENINTVNPVTWGAGVGHRLILDRHTPRTSAQPDNLSKDTIRALLRPFFNLEKPEELAFAENVVFKYAARVVQLLNARKNIEEAVKTALERHRCQLVQITIPPDFDRGCFSDITIKATLDGQPLYPYTRRPPQLSGDVRQAIADVLRPLGIVSPHIIIPSEYQDGPVQICPDPSWMTHL